MPSRTLAITRIMAEVKNMTSTEQEIIEEYDALGISVTVERGFTRKPTIDKKRLSRFKRKVARKAAKKK